jgi:hypothetical protein
MNNLCVDINLKIFPLKDTASKFSDPHNFPEKHNLQHIIFNPLESFISQEILDFYDSLGLTTSFAECFYTPPNRFTPIHRDAPRRPPNLTKMNWCYGGKGSTMNWYKEKSTSVENIARRNSSVTFHEYTLYKKEELTQLHSQPISSPSLVQVGIPHNITNLEEPRIVVSTFLFWKKNNDFLKFEEAIEVFKDYLLI